MEKRKQCAAEYSADYRLRLQTTQLSRQMSAPSHHTELQSFIWLHNYTSISHLFH